MKKKKVRRKPATIGTPEEKRTKKETIMHYNAVLMEHLDSKYNLLLEFVKPIPAMRDDISSLREAVGTNSERLSTVEQAVRSNSGRLSTIEFVIRGLKDDMLDMEHRLSSKINRITERCENHECRLGTLEVSQ